MEFTNGGGGGLAVTDEDNSYRTTEAGDSLSIDSYEVVSSDIHGTHSTDSENNVIPSTLRDRFQQRRPGCNGLVKKVAGSGWPNSKPDPGHEYKGCGLIVQMPRKWSSNISSFGSKIYDFSSNLFSRSHANRYKPRQNIGNDDFEVIEKQELMRLQLLTSSNGSPTTKVAPTTLMRGHRFVPVNLKQPNWCDKCGIFIWGVYKYCYICINCRYTCHLKCREAVTLDCIVTADDKSSLVEEEMEETSFDDDDNSENEPENDDESGYFTLRSRAGKSLDQENDQMNSSLRDVLKKRIDEFNNNNHGLQMTLDMLEDSSSFNGCIRVHMNLIRPITMSVSPSPPSIYAALTHDTECNTLQPHETQVTSFYLPRNTSKVIHIKSTTTVLEVIRALLSKFNITDNPRKFTLYEKFIGDRKTGVMRRMVESELPLDICLSWSDGGVDQLDSNAFVLQENDCGGILWDDFSIPELESFVNVLNREEKEHMEQVKEKYRIFRIQLQNQLRWTEQNKNFVSTDRRQPVFI